MPIDVNGVGHSEYTQGKLLNFAGIMEMHAQICRLIQAKYPRSRYFYFDLNAGVGEVEGRDGSVVLAARALEKHLAEWRLYAVDQNPSSPGLLQERLAAFNHERIRTEWGDNRAVAPSWLGPLPSSNVYGLVFHDPNGVPDFEMIQGLFTSPKLHRVDVLIYMSAAGWKRYRTAGNAGARCLQQELATINKRYWIVRNPAGKHQWTFLLGTNWAEFPKWERAGFYRTDEPQGWKVLLDLSDTQRENKYRIAWQTPQLPFKEAEYTSYAEYLRHPKFLEVRQQVWKRAGGICEVCKRSPATEPHHLVYPAWGAFDVPENLVAVCHGCHCVLEGKAR